jgi:hypothetical protein
VRRIVPIIVLGLVAAGCRDVGSARVTSLPAPAPLQVLESPTPFTEVAAGPVHAMVPDRWHPVSAAETATDHEGVFASPQPRQWKTIDGSVAGMAAVWVDLARVGIPSDYYYLAATGPALEQLTHSSSCDVARDVIVNHRPAYFQGRANSPGDYVARGEGSCTVGTTPTRFAYFVAAPGYGPVRKVGIPSSGLYVLVAVLPDGRGVGGRLRALMNGASFNGAGVGDFIDAATPGR